MRKKIEAISLVKEVIGELIVEDKLSLEKCKQILGKNSMHTDNEIIILRDWFYKLAAIAYEEFQAKSDKQTISITQEKDKDDEESYYLRAS
jgi:hypothetical protein